MSDPLVLIPGLQSDGSSWMPLLQQLCHVHPVCVPMGHQFAPDIAAMARCVLDQSPPRFHLMGWSMGGYIAFEIIRSAVDRLASVTLISTTAAPESAASSVRRTDALQQAHALGLRDYQAANLGACLFDPLAVGAPWIDPLLHASEALGFDAFATQTRAIVARPDSRPDLVACPVPILIVAGRDDTIIPIAHAREMHSLRPDAAYHEIPDCGHCPPLERPQLVAEIVNDWLARLGPEVKGPPSMGTA